MPEVPVPWGSDELKISVPDHWTVQQVATPALRPAPRGWAERMAAALNQPVCGPPLGKLLAARHGGRIALIVEDVTRHSPLGEILQLIMREIHHAGIDNDLLEIFFASGMHQPMTPAQAAEKLGPAVKGIRWRCNPWRDASAYVHVGNLGKVDVLVDRAVAGADLRIIISSVSPHLQAGFGGGYKMLLPGCASLETIRALHRLGIGRTARQLVGTGSDTNSMRAAIDAGGRLIDAACGRSFAVQYLLDESDRPAFVAAGDVLPTHQMLAKQCAVACGIVMDRPADVLITNAHPRDFDLWQSFKCIANTRWAARPGGIIICLARCPSSLGGMKVTPWPLSPKWTRRLISLIGPNALHNTVTRLRPGLAGDAAFFIRMAVQTLHRNPILIFSPELHDSRQKFPGLDIFGDPARAVAAADALLGGGPQRVTVFPSGGVTFPVMVPRRGAAAPPGAQ